MGWVVTSNFDYAIKSLHLSQIDATLLIAWRIPVNVNDSISVAYKATFLDTLLDDEFFWDDQIDFICKKSNRTVFL